MSSSFSARRTISERCGKMQCRGRRFSAVSRFSRRCQLLHPALACCMCPPATRQGAFSVVLRNRIWQALDFIPFELTCNVRALKDPGWADFLAKVRMGHHSMVDTDRVLPASNHVPPSPVCSSLVDATSKTLRSSSCLKTMVTICRFLGQSSWANASRCV